MVTAAAKRLGVSRGSLPAFFNGCNGVSSKMAIRLEMGGEGLGRIVAAQPIVVRPLACAPARGVDQGKAVSSAGSGLKGGPAGRFGEIDRVPLTAIGWRSQYMCGEGTAAGRLPG